MRKYLWSIAVLFAAMGTPTALLANTVYAVNQAIGSASATGYITTNGNTGVLTTADILDWDLTLNDGSHVGEINSTNSVVIFGNHDLGIGSGNVDVTATSANLMFNYSAPDGGYLGFSGAAGQICYTAWSNCWGPTAVGLFGVDGVGGSVFVPETGNQNIAAAVPEPSSFLLLGSGLGVAISGVRRKLRR